MSTQHPRIQRIGQINGAPYLDASRIAMKNCAYCGKSEKLTKEHIWPNTLIKKYEDLLTYNKNQNKFYKGDAVIKDVCSECNNIHLSKLDSYLSGLFDAYLKII